MTFMEELRNRLSALEKHADGIEGKVDKILSELIGDKEFQTPGIVGEVKAIRIQQKQHEMEDDANHRAVMEHIEVLQKKNYQFTVWSKVIYALVGIITSVIAWNGWTVIKSLFTGKA